MIVLQICNFALYIYVYIFVSFWLCTNFYRYPQTCWKYSDRMRRIILFFSGLSVALGTLRTNVDARIETRSKLAGLFASQIGKDTMELMLDVNKLRDEVVVSYYGISLYYSGDNSLLFILFFLAYLIILTISNNITI